jgi:hypothetical protein
MSTENGTNHRSRIETKPGQLSEVRAENDYKMLLSALLQTAWYYPLFNLFSGSFIVGGMEYGLWWNLVVINDKGNEGT